MLKAYITYVRLVVNDELRYVSATKIELLTEEEVKERETKVNKNGNTFGSLWEHLSVRYCDNKLTETLFTNKKKIVFIHGDKKTIKEGQPVNWEYKIIIRPFDHLTVKDLQKLPVDKAIQYCAERGASVIFSTERM